MARAAALPILTAEAGLTRYLEEIRRFPMLEPQEEYMLAKRWREHGDRDAAHQLVTSHLRLVAKIAMGYRGYGLPISEVISEGNVGLMQAVKRFEPDKGFRLATYAMWWIKASIQEYILRSWSLVKMGTTANQKKLFFNLRKAKSKISALEEGDLRPDQVKIIAKRLGVTEQDVVDMNRRLGGDASLNAPIREDGDSGEWQDWLVDDSASQETRARRAARSWTTAARRCRRARRAQRPRAAHLRGAAAGRRSGHARGAGRGVRRLARARAPDRGARLREGAEGGEEQGGGHGNAPGRRAARARPGALIAQISTLRNRTAPGHARSWLCGIAQEDELGVVVGAALHFCKAFRRGEAGRGRLLHHRERAGAEPATLARRGERSFGQPLPIGRIEKNERERREAQQASPAGWRRAGRSGLHRRPRALPRSPAGARAPRRPDRQTAQTALRAKAPPNPALPFRRKGRGRARREGDRHRRGQEY